MHFLECNESISDLNISHSSTNASAHARTLISTLHYTSEPHTTKLTLPQSVNNFEVGTISLTLIHIWQSNTDRGQAGREAHLDGLFQLGGEAGHGLLHALVLVALPLEDGGLGLHLLHDVVQVFVHAAVLHSLQLQLLLGLNVSTIYL